jgi:hypothetical protein
MHRAARASFAVSIALFLLLAVPGGHVTPAGAAPTSGWSIQPSPSVPGSPWSGLLSVSCAGDGTCMAVGQYSPSGGGIAPLAEHFDGSSWNLEIPADPTGSSASLLTGVSCATPTLCMAVGYSVAGSVVSPLVEMSDATTWRAVATPQPPDSSWAILQSIACTSRDCIAVGGFIKNGVDAQEQPLSERWNGRAWSLIPTLNPHAENGSALTAVTCVAAGDCEAVGEFVFADVEQNVFAFGWNGRIWTFQHQPNPKGGEENSDDSVGCIDASTCESVGSFGDVHGLTHALGEGWNGTSWVKQDVPNPSGFQISELHGVACSSPDCEAVGDWSASQFGFPSSTLAEQWNGTAWSIQSTPNPTGATESALQALVCTAATACVAVGNWYDGSVTRTLVETYSA